MFQQGLGIEGHGLDYITDYLTK